MISQENKDPKIKGVIVVKRNKDSSVIWNGYHMFGCPLELMISQQFDMVKITFNRIQKLDFGLKSSLFGD